ncbi:hypothetical protein PV04_10893 [Phialophora macrospora]|uniref:Uncharacterized protein n=1 Tax=Phialophora macrospora TaxID=1851006 RepID=A0A0D2F4B7_9EURO|nr:hypothetical protein PV04_10893 [Phialophora macrospora]
MKPRLFPFPLFWQLALLFLALPSIVVPVRVHALPVQEPLALRAVDSSVLESLALAYTAYLEKKQQVTARLLDTIAESIESTKSVLDTDFELTRALLAEVGDLLQQSNDGQSESNDVARQNAEVQKRSLAIQERTLQLAEKSNRGAVEQIVTA